MAQQQDDRETRTAAGAAASSAVQLFNQARRQPGTAASAAAAVQAEQPALQPPEQPQQVEAAAPAATTPNLQQLQLQQLQQQQQAWLAAWQQDQAPGSSGSGSSLGAMLGQVSGGFPATPTMEMLEMHSSWQAEQRSTDNPAASPLDVLGRQGLPAGLQQRHLARQLSALTSGAQYAPTSSAGNSYRQPSAAVQYALMSLPASPTMLQHQLLPMQPGRPASGSHSISPSSGSWPDVDLEQPLAPQTATAAVAGAAGENGENGDSLLWPCGQLVQPPGNTPPLLHQPGVPLGLQLRLSEQQHQGPAATQQQQQLDPAMLREQADAGVVMLQQQQYAGRTAAGTASDQQLLQQLQDQARMPPPLPLQPGIAAAASVAAARNTAPRPPPLIIPSTQPPQVCSQQQLSTASAPTPSPAQPSGTSITPAMLSMGLTDVAAAGLTGMPAATAASTGAGAAALGQQPEEGSQLSSRPRRQRRRTSVPSSPAVSAAKSASPQLPTGAAALLAAGRQYLKIVCGTLQGWLDLTDMMVQVSAGQGAGYTGEYKVTPAGFEALAGKGATRKWRQSLTVLPDGPTDPWVSEPMPVGDFMKQYQLDKGSMLLQAQQRASLSSIQDEGSLLSPAAAAAAAAVGVRHHPLVSPGVRRRRQQLPVQHQIQQHDADAAASDDQLHVKRSRGSSGPQQQHYWQEPIDAWHAAAAAGQQQHVASMQRAYSADQLPLSQQEYQAMAAGGNISADGQFEQQHIQLQQQARMGLGRDQAASAELVQYGHRSSQQQNVVAQQMQLPLPSMHWRSQSPQQLEAAGAAGAAAGMAAVAGSAVPIEHEPPGLLCSISAEQQQSQLSQQFSQQSSQHSSQQGTPAEASGSGADVPEKPLLSPAGRPLRQPSIRQQRAAAAAAAAASSRHDRGGQSAGFAGGVLRLQVWCDQLPGMLDLQKMQVTPQEGEHEGQPMSLSAFEQLGGRGAARKWRRSLTTLDGNEPITLGEWMERYQLMPGSESKHISPKLTSKPRASTPPAGAAATGPAGGRDQHGSKRHSKLPPEYVAALPVHPAALASSAKAQQQQKSGRRRAQQASPQAAAVPAASQLPPVPTGANVYRSPGSSYGPRTGSSPSGSLLQPPAVEAPVLLGRDLDVRRMSRDSNAGQTQQLTDAYTQAPAQPASLGHTAAAAAGDTVNTELYLMLTEYASEFSHPELHLHPAQVEQDLADLTAVGASSGVLSPQLAGMDWQQQQQQIRQQQPAGVQALLSPRLGAMDWQQQSLQAPQQQRQGVMAPAVAAAVQSGRVVSTQVGGINWHQPMPPAPLPQLQSLSPPAAAAPSPAAAAAHSTRAAMGVDDIEFSPAALLAGPVDPSERDTVAAYNQAVFQPPHQDSTGGK